MRKTEIGQSPPVREGLGTDVPLAGPMVASGWAVAITIGTAAMIGIGLALPSQAATPEPTISYQKQVFPILEGHCLNCHGPGGIGEISSSLDLSSYKTLRMGSVQGVAIVPFHSDRSPMIRLLKNNWKSKNPEVLKMPPFGPQLSPKDLKVISDWIDQGAKDN